MPISVSAAEAWTRVLTQQNVVGYLQLKTGYGTVGFVSGTRSADTVVTSELIGVVTTYTKNEIDGTLIQQNDLMVTVDATIAVSKDDITVINSEDYRIVDIEVINIAGTLIGYILQVRL